MMIHTKLAKKVLTKHEQNHLTQDGNIHSMAALNRQIKFQIKTNPKDPGQGCQECWNIAKKLNVV